MFFNSIQFFVKRRSLFGYEKGQNCQSKIGLLEKYQSFFPKNPDLQKSTPDTDIKQKTPRRNRIYSIRANFGGSPTSQFRKKSKNAIETPPKNSRMPSKFMNFDFNTRNA